MEYRYKLDRHIIARRVREGRKNAGLTQEQLAEKIDISANAVAKLENEFMFARLETLLKIANVLQVDINYLLREDGGHAGADDSDALLLELLPTLSPADKQFLLHTIRGLKVYHAAEE